MADILRVTFVGGRTYDAAVTPKGEVEFEREFDLPFYEVNRRRERFYWLAWKLMSLSGQETRDFDAFIGDVDNIEAVNEDKDADKKSDPTPPPAPSVDSSDSPLQRVS